MRAQQLAAIIVTTCVVAVSAEAQTISFVDVSNDAGLRTSGVGHGVSVHDFDRDGDDDVFVATVSGTSRLFRNDGNAVFTDATEEAGLSGIGAYSVALWGDVDADGRDDLFLGRSASGRSRLFRNTGGGRFEDISSSSGLDPDLSIATAAFGDADGDGAIDLFVAVHQGPDVLYRNTGGEGAVRFEDVTALAGVGGPAHAVPMQVSWVDYDRDGDQDLFCVHDGRLESRLYENGASWPMQNVAFASRIDTYPSASVCCNMGTAWADFDGDGWEDVYVTRIGQGGLFRNNGDGSFTDEAADRGAERNGMSWGVVWMDVENDGDLDLFVVSTSGYDGTPTLLFRNDDGAFTEIGRQAGASFRIDARGLAAGDLNGDGLLDLVISSTDGRNRVLMNTTRAAGHWVGIEVRSGSTPAVGTRVEVVAAGRTQVRTVSGGDSYASQSSAKLHFGIGSATIVDTLRIFWAGADVQEATGLPADTVYAMTQRTSTTSRDHVGLPEVEPGLVAVFPNPARDVAEISYVVNRPEFVRIDVYDTLGRRRAVLVNGPVQAGRHSIRFDAGAFTSGLYLIRFHAEERSAAWPLLVAR